MKHKFGIFGAMVGLLIGPAWPFLFLFLFIAYLFHDGEWELAVFLIAAFIGILYWIAYDVAKKSEERDAKLYGKRRPPVKGCYPQYTVHFLEYRAEDGSEELNCDMALGTKFELYTKLLKPDSIENKKFIFIDEVKDAFCARFSLPEDGELTMDVAKNGLFYGVRYSLYIYDNKRLYELKGSMESLVQRMSLNCGKPFSDKREKNKRTVFWFGEVIASDSCPVKMSGYASFDHSPDTKSSSLYMSISADDYSRLDPDWLKTWS